MISRILSVSSLVLHCLINLVTSSATPRNKLTFPGRSQPASSSHRDGRAGLSPATDLLQSAHGSLRTMRAPTKFAGSACVEITHISLAIRTRATSSGEQAGGFRAALSEARPGMHCRYACMILSLVIDAPQVSAAIQFGITRSATISMQPGCCSNIGQGGVRFRTNSSWDIQSTRHALKNS
jgi:hypothetical protein